MKKKCFKCKQVKDIKLFYKHSEMADGHLNKCKRCTKKDAVNNYRKNIDYYKMYNKLRENNPERKAKKISYQRNYREKNKGKYKANRKVANALKYGILVRKPCEVCGNAKSEAHHEDYRKYLDVKWLCFKHHREIHQTTILTNSMR